MKEDLTEKVEDIFKNKTFSQNIYYDIFKIFKNKGEPYSNNSNGVFINLNDCKEDTIKEVYNYIKNIEKNNLEHEIYLQTTEKKIDDLRKTIKDSDKKEPKIKKFRKPKQKNTVSNKILDKELQPEKPVYKGVYKRLYNCMKGYKNNKVPVKKSKEVEVDVDMDIDIEDVEVDIEDTVEDIEEVDVVEDIEDADVVEEINFEDLNNDNDDLFGDSESDIE